MSKTQTKTAPYHFVLDKEDTRTCLLQDTLQKAKYSTEMLCFASVPTLTPANKPKTSKQKVYILSPKKQLTSDLLASLSDHSLIFAYALPNECKSLVTQKNLTIHTYDKDPWFLYQNANLTAEGVLAHLIQNTTTCLSETSTLILGGGRIAKCLAHYLAPFCVATFVTKDKTESAYLSTTRHCVHNPHQLTALLPKQDVIINTIPHPLLKPSHYKKCQKNVVLIELASQSGLDPATASKCGITVTRLDGVPAKTASKSASNLLLAFVTRTLGLSMES
ncbi:MAG: hypothetical protein FWD76_02230 [Firmicutes bacterium]|nr:hypothetical protein [Bacillota bacterium]